MKNIFRFVLGLVLFFVLGILGIFLIIPLFVGSILYGIISAVVIVIIVVVGYFVFVWHFFRREDFSDKTKNYSIRQGREVKP